MVGDGECEEGQIWEAAMFSSHHKIDNLIAMVDWNGQKYCEIWRHEWEVIQNRYLDANDRPELLF